MDNRIVIPNSTLIYEEVFIAFSLQVLKSRQCPCMYQKAAYNIYKYEKGSVGVDKVTILIPFYNRDGLLQETLDTVLNQTYQHWRVILIDDASTDSTVTSITPYLSNPRIKLIQNPVNLGKSKSLNKALEIVDTPYILELDSDDWLFPFSIDVLLAEAERQPEKVAVICGNIIGVIEDHKGKVIANRAYYGKPFVDKYDFILSNRVLWPRFYRTSALKKVGGWPTNTPDEGRSGIDDLGVLLKLVEDHSFYWINEFLLKVRMHPDSLSFSHIPQINNVKEWLVRNALKRWGGHFEPVFTVDEDGWKYVTELIPEEDDLSERE